ncbi:MAG: hypothetical protein WD894_20100 [Pirellulales bacterium]
MFRHNNVSKVLTCILLFLTATTLRAQNRKNDARDEEAELLIVAREAYEWSRDSYEVGARLAEDVRTWSLRVARHEAAKDPSSAYERHFVRMEKMHQQNEEFHKAMPSPKAPENSLAETRYYMLEAKQLLRKAQKEMSGANQSTKAK